MLQLAAPGQAQHADDGVVQVVGLDLEQLVARVVLQHGEQVAPGVAAGGEPGTIQHGIDLAPDHRQLAYRVQVRGRGEQAEEALLAVDVAVLVEGLDADVVEVRRAVHGRTRVGLGDDQ